MLKPFNPNAAVQAVDYLLNNISKSMPKLDLLRLLYLAEKYCIQRYATSITYDDFYALKSGIAGKNASELLDFKDTQGVQYAKELLEQDGDFIKTRSKLVNKDLESYDDISEIGMEALDFAIGKFERYNSQDLVDIFTFFDEWQEFKQYLKDDNFIYKIDENKIFSTNIFYVCLDEKVLELKKETFTKGGFFD